jgi:hypothetical protein
MRPARTKTVLVVADPLVGETVRDVLSYLGVACVVAASSRDAVKELWRGVPALVLVDLDRDSRFLADEDAAALLVDVPVVALVEDGADYRGPRLSKPLRIDRLLETVERFCLSPQAGAVAVPVPG